MRERGFYRDKHWVPAGDYRRAHAEHVWQVMQCWLLLCSQRKELEQEIENLRYDLMGDDL